MFEKIFKKLSLYTSRVREIKSIIKPLIFLKIFLRLNFNLFYIEKDRSII